MAKTTIPTDPDQRFKEFIEKSDALEGAKITTDDLAKLRAFLRG
jgi:hypothetical protein